MTEIQLGEKASIHFKSALYDSLYSSKSYPIRSHGVGEEGAQWIRKKLLSYYSF